MKPEFAKIIKKLAKLRVDRSKGVAPHKQLLLLVVIELANSGLLADTDLRLTPELAFRFSVFWSVVAHRRSQPPDVRLPFHHIGSSKLWTPLTSSGVVSEHRDTTVMVRLADSFVDAIDSPGFRQAATYTLVSNYFEAAEQLSLFELLGLHIPENVDELDALAIEAQTNARARGRSARFRVDVVAAYCHTCALTGYRITTINGNSIVDAAHIHQFANSRNDDPKNGIALCKNAHWLFDLGLWSIDDDYCVIVAEEAFDEANPTQESLTSMAGNRLILPRDEKLWPSRKALKWHRRHCFVDDGLDSNDI